VLPARCQAGVCLHITSLPGRHGIGEIGAAARAFVDALAAMQLRVWQFLPTGPTAWGNSPYQPLSTFAGNELLIDIDTLCRDGFLKPAEIAPLYELPREQVDYGRLISIKPALLALAASRFAAKASARLKAARDDFVDRHERHWLRDYALFRLLKTRHAERPWPAWDPAYVHRDTRAMRAFESRERDEIDAVRTLQFLFHRQWKELHRYATEKGVRLFGDLPIYAALDGADAWSRRELFRIDRDGRPDRVAGVPPDYFSADGQLWGNPLYDWPYHASTGYAWWIERLGHAAAASDLVRIDHFRAFEAYWSVPAGEATARNGRWEPGPGSEVFDAVQKALGAVPIVAENLGVITPEVERLRQRYRMPGMRVLQFDIVDERFDPRSIDENCVFYTGTHDNDTAVGWFHGGAGSGVGNTRTPEEAARLRQRVLEVTGGTPDAIHEYLLRIALDSSARLAIAPMQDYLGLGSDARLNTPGTTGGNWRWRLRTLPSAARQDRIGEMIASAGRAG
jgi:4-alpha-glucanotransferase